MTGLTVGKNSFDPANLSPQPKALTPCDLPYGLTWENLQPALPEFDAQGSNQAQAYTSYTKQGLNSGDNSCILTIRYPIGEHRHRSKTLFFKHNEGPNKAEALKYQFLASQNIPTPQLITTIKSVGSETIILEFIPTIGIDFSSPGEVDRSLDLAARINSVQNPPDIFISHPGLPEDEFSALVFAAIKKLEYVLIRAGGKSEVDAERWFAAYQTVEEVVQQLPRALNHNQFYFQQVGWVQRGASRQMVVFDLETMYLSPRYTDIATILYPLSIYTGRNQLDLFQIYLEKLSRFTHVDLSLDAAFRDFRYTRFHYMCQSLPWLTDQVERPEEVEKNENLSMTLNALFDDFFYLNL